MMHNKNGLSRYIPAEISREVRHRCGFGCVICGNAVYTYEHIDPPFAEALEHDPSKITLLCAGCHGKVTRGLTSKNTVLEYSKKPKAFEMGFSREAFDITASYPRIELCGTTFHGIRTVVAMMGVEILKVESPECEGAPMRISALFCDKEGNEVFRIVENEWFSSVGNWDVEVIGRRIFFRRAPGDIALVIRAVPPETIAIERISMFYKGARVTGIEGSSIDAIAPNGSGLMMVVGSVYGNGKEVGLFIDNRGLLFGYGGEFSALVAERG